MVTPPDDGNARMSYRENAVFRFELKNAMRRNGWDQKAVADAIGLKQQSVSSFLRAESGVRRQTAVKIATLIGKDFDRLCAQASAEQESELSDDQRERLNRLIERLGNPTREYRRTVGGLRLKVPRSIERIMVEAEGLGIPSRIVADRIRAIKGQSLSDDDAQSLSQSEERSQIYEVSREMKAAYDAAVSVLRAAAKGVLTYDQARPLARTAIELDIGGRDALAVLDRAPYWVRAAVEVADTVIEVTQQTQQRPTEEDDASAEGASGPPFSVDKADTDKAVEKYFTAPPKPTPAPPNREERRTEAKRAASSKK